MRKAEVCINARVPPALLAVIGQVTKHITVKSLFCRPELEPQALNLKMSAALTMRPPCLPNMCSDVKPVLF